MIISNLLRCFDNPQTMLLTVRAAERLKIIAKVNIPIDFRLNTRCNALALSLLTFWRWHFKALVALLRHIGRCWDEKDDGRDDQERRNNQRYAGECHLVERRRCLQEVNAGTAEEPSDQVGAELCERRERRRCSNKLKVFWHLIIINYRLLAACWLLCQERERAGREVQSCWQVGISSLNLWCCPLSLTFHWMRKRFRCWAFFSLCTTETLLWRQASKLNFTLQW